MQPKRWSTLAILKTAAGLAGAAMPGRLTAEPVRKEHGLSAGYRALRDVAMVGPEQAQRAGDGVSRLCIHGPHLSEGRHTYRHPAHKIAPA